MYIVFLQEGGGEGGGCWNSKKWLVNRSEHSTLSLRLSEDMAACQDDSDISSEDYTSDEEIMLPEIRALKQAHEKGALHTQQERIIQTRKDLNDRFKKLPKKTAEDPYGRYHTFKELKIWQGILFCRKMLVSVLKTTKKGYSESGGRVMRLFTFLSFDNF